MSDEDSEDSEPVPRWRKVFAIVVFIILVVPLFGVIAYPVLTGTSAKAALGQYVGYLNSPPILVFWVVMIIFVWISLLRKRLG